MKRSRKPLVLLLILLLFFCVYLIFVTVSECTPTPTPTVEYSCSSCGLEFGEFLIMYCPRCGAGQNTEGVDKVVMNSLMPPTATPTPTPTPTPLPADMPEYIDLEYGMVDHPDYPYVTKLQDRLCELGYLTSNMSYTYGTLDDSTLSAWMQFCRDNGLPLVANNMVIPASYQRFLHAHWDPCTCTPLPTPTHMPEYIDLEYGMVDDPGLPYIATMQDRLCELGYLTIDTFYTCGTYDDATAAALNQFYIENGLFAEEFGYKVSVPMLFLLYSAGAHQFNASMSPSEIISSIYVDAYGYVEYLGLNISLSLDKETITIQAPGFFGDGMLAFMPLEQYIESVSIPAVLLTNEFSYRVTSSRDLDHLTYGHSLFLQSGDELILLSDAELSPDALEPGKYLLRIFFSASSGSASYSGCSFLWLIVE